MPGRKLLTLISAVLAAALLASGCAAAAEKPAASREAVLKITGIKGGDISADMGDIKSLKIYEGKAEGNNSAGEPVVFDIKGGYFSDLLEKNGYSQADIAGIRIIALDGYSIEVSQDILKARDIIIAYEMDGKPLDADNAPFRIFIPGERAMYWVRMVSEINIIGTEEPGEVTGIYIMESLYGEETWEDYRFVSDDYKVLNTKSILEDRPGTKGGVVLMTAADGLEKNETVENFYKGAINMTGENSPEFFSNILPKGMFVKDLVMFKYGGNAFYFAGARGSVSLADLLKYCGMRQADEYVLSFSGGIEQTVSAAELSLWTLSVSGGQVSAGKRGAEAQSGLELITAK